MTRRELIRHSIDALSPRYGEREAGAIAWLVAETSCGFDRAQAVLEPDATVVGDRYAVQAVERIAAGQPVQYALGRAWFCGLEFEVAEGVLIPRPETGELVEWIVALHEDDTRAVSILDIGTGSGAIAISLALAIPGAHVTGLDVSGDALAIAGLNARKLGARVEFLRADILSWRTENKFDVVVSNPPYIPMREKSSMAAHVVDHEPHEALFVPDDDPLLFYRAIARAELLHKGGELYFEVHEDHAAEVCDMLRRESYADVELRRDINEKPRMVRCVKA